MIDYHKEIVSALNSVLPTHYELALTTNTKLPCISYKERTIYMLTDALGAVNGYSRIAYTIKLWGYDMEEIQRYALEVDAVLRPLGWKRTSSQELHNATNTMLQKIMTYEALAIEDY